MWFAVNENGEGGLYPKQPERKMSSNGEGYWLPIYTYLGYLALCLNKSDWPVPDMTWEDEPVEVELKVKAQTRDIDKDWTMLSTWEDELHKIDETINELVSKIIISDGEERLKHENSYRLARRR